MIRKRKGRRQRKVRPAVRNPSKAGRMAISEIANPINRSIPARRPTKGQQATHSFLKEINSAPALAYITPVRIPAYAMAVLPIDSSMTTRIIAIQTIEYLPIREIIFSRPASGKKTYAPKMSRANNPGTTTGKNPKPRIGLCFQIVFHVCTRVVR
jgi:hypothetical protein